jgi:hypothetical protein
VVAYPEPYLELRFLLRSVLYKVTRPLVCSLASSTQSSLVSSLPRFALRPFRLKPSLARNGSLRTLRLFVRSSLGYSTQCEPYPVGDYSRTLPTNRRILKTTLSIRIRPETTLKTLPVYDERLVTRPKRNSSGLRLDKRTSLNPIQNSFGVMEEQSTPTKPSETNSRTMEPSLKLLPHILQNKMVWQNT